MFNEYCEAHFIEPSEVQAIIEEAKQKLHEAINDEAKNVLGEYKTAKKELETLGVKIRAKEHKIRQLNNELKQLEEKHEAEKYDMPRKYIEKLVRDITGNFAPGDKVWIIDTKCKWEKCDKCKGTKKITATIDGEPHTIECVKCKGYGETRIITKETKETRIENVHLKLCFREDGVGVWTSDSVYIWGREYATDPKKLYRTQEEAEKAMKGDNNE